MCAGLSRTDSHCVTRAEHAVSRLVAGEAHGGEMSHLSTRPRRRLAVEVQPHGRNRERCREVGSASVPQIAEEVRDRRRTKDFRAAECQVAYRANELL